MIRLRSYVVVATAVAAAAAVAQVWSKASLVPKIAGDHEAPATILHHMPTLNLTFFHFSKCSFS